MLAPGTEVGRYRIESLLGSGGMGEVYRAYDSVLRRRVALKVLRPDLPDAAARLLREGRAAAALSHPNAVAIYDVGEAAGITFIAMELVEGKPMRDFVGDKNVPIPERVRWLVDLAHALSAAHNKGFVHRDIKPDNVMICSDRSVKLLDFGIAKQAGPDVPPPSIAQSGPSSYKTAEGRVTGTPRYMAPEQLRGDPLDPRTDQYAWGVVAYELLAGVHPLSIGDGTRPAEMLNQRIPNLSFDVAAVVARAMAPMPELRFPTLDEAAAVLERYITAPVLVPAVASSSHVTPIPAQTPTVDMTPISTASVGARVHDPIGTRSSRLLVPAIATVVLIVSFVTAARSRHDSPYVLLVALVFFSIPSALVLLFRPLFALRKDARPAKVSARNGFFGIAGAGPWSQTFRPAGASIVSTAQGASLVVARPGAFAPAIRVDLSSTEEAEALLRGAGMARTPSGVVRWTTGRGVFDALAIAAGLGWRVAWPVIVTLTLRAEMRLAGALLIVTFLLALAASVLKVLEPGPGPHVTLSDRGVDASGFIVRHAEGRSESVSELSIPLATIADVRHVESGIEISTATGERWLVRIVPVRWSNRGLKADEIELVASHLRAAARARSGTFPAMMPANAVVESRYRAASRTT